MYDFKNVEEEILKFWKSKKIFEKSVEMPAGKKPKKDFIFYDGPPFITGLPHYGTLLPSIIKDVVPRFWSMKGFKVERVWGWDCHGLPAENKVEEQLGLKNKKDIEKLGIGKFVNSCKTYVSNVSSEWEWYIDRIGRWVDMKNAYKTMDIEFMESVMWAFKELYDKKLIYEGYRSSLHCPRCATPLSKFELTMDAGAYQNVTEMSSVLKFELVDSSKLGLNKKTHVLAWTTTPWTLPGNLALAVGNKIDYVIVEINNEYYILAKERMEDILKDIDYKELKKIKGDKLVGLSYEPLFDLENKIINEDKQVYKIYNADFVSTEDGTGVVHIAPNFGEDDFEFGKENKLPMIELMDETGTYTNEVAGWEGIYFKDANKKSLNELGNKLFKKFNYTHSYPFCHRCKTPLIYKTQKAWYLNIDKIRNKMLKTNKNINWVPDYFKEGRFKHNLETAPHWCLSRSRYFGSPLPIWKCEKCEKLKVPGSIKEIEKLSGKKVTDLHVPKINDHIFKCDCGGKMKRLPEVLDCWFESGSMPFAQWHYPFERKEGFKNIFPADFITEYTGQLRGWFYVLHALSNALFDSESFKNVIVTGVLAGNDGRKMSKLFGNYPDPKETILKYGGDTLRMYFLSSPVITGGDMNINERDIQDTMRKNVMLLMNIYQFYNMSPKNKKKADKNILDDWIMSKLNKLLKEVTENMEKYELPFAARQLTGFIENFSWYIRLNRERIDETSAVEILKEVLEKFSLVSAPFMPFLSEEIWQGVKENNFKKEESVHLQPWPKYSKKIDEKLIEDIENARKIISFGLRERDREKIGLRWPLSKVIVYFKKLDKKFEEIIKDQLNVKNIEWKKTSDSECKIELDTKLTPELEAEGYAREISRKVQAFRKNLGLNKKDSIETIILVDEKFKEILEKSENFIKERTNSSSIKFISEKSKETFKNKEDFKIKDKKGEIVIIFKE